MPKTGRTRLPQLTGAERQWLEDLTDDVYYHAFHMLDAEPLISGDTAGKIATQTANAFLRAMGKMLGPR